MLTSRIVKKLLFISSTHAAIFDFSFERDKSVSITKALIFDGNASEINPMPKTDHGFRKIPVLESTAAFLKKYMAVLKGSHLFTCGNGSLITPSYLPFPVTPSASAA